MTAESREELLSAYLDDELSPHERAQVEQWLLDSAEYRRVFDELRNARADMQSLPRHKLSEDLGQTVLRRAERAVLAGEEAADGGGSITPGSAASRWWSRAGSKRMFIWPAVAVAAALLVALFDTTRDADREVAVDKLDRVEEGIAHDEGTRLGVELNTLDEKSAATAGEASDLPTLSVAPAQTAAPRAANRSRIATEPDDSARSEDMQREDAGSAGEAIMADEAPAAPTIGAQDRLSAKQPQQKIVEDLKLETDVRRALVNREQVNFIQCDVTPEFISDNQMEKVLSSNRAKFVRLAEPEAAEDRVAPKKEGLSKPGLPLELRYSVEATPVQVEKIVTELDEQRGRKRVSNMILGLQEQAPAAGRKFAGAAPERQAGTDLYRMQQPVTIYLRQMTPPAQSGEPPAPADEP